MNNTSDFFIILCICQSEIQIQRAVGSDRGDKEREGSDKSSEAFGEMEFEDISVDSIKFNEPFILDDFDTYD